MLGACWCVRGGRSRTPVTTIGRRPRPGPCRSWHVQTMPMSALTSISHLRAPNEMRFASPCAKFQALQHCRSKFLQTRELVRPNFLKNSAGQKWNMHFEQAKHFCFGQGFSWRCRYALCWCPGIPLPLKNSFDWFLKKRQVLGRILHREKVKHFLNKVSNIFP